ncbi:hypothetical protein [Paenibacillus sp. sgz302251]|uniref:hypothetical protein n=1 Tax=Paenibacillus sp. sgz302251 TaxID=3414493 RepID=UPI003C7E0BB5
MVWEDEYGYGDFLNVVFVDRDKTDYSVYFDLREMPNPQEQKRAHVVWASKQAFKDKLKKWENILRDDFRKKAGMTEKDTEYWFKSSFYKTVITKYMFPLFCMQFYYCLSDSVTNNLVKFDRNKLMKEMEVEGTEFFKYLTANLSEDMMKKIVGPVMKSFMSDGYYDGQSYAAKDALDAIMGK